jgi:dihydrofolate synthase/folylpolyglutamate synthase
MTFSQAEQFLYSLSNLPRKEYMTDETGCKEYLPRVQFFLDLLGNPEQKIPHYIHVTGTSGKGSTVNYLHSILQSAGKHVASTTSPHPTSITERWKVGSTCMTKKEFVEIVERIIPTLDTYIRTSPYELPSYFEMTVIIALSYFAEKKVDWAILEVGCGGMYDATNVIPRKDVAVITNVGLDHTDLLGKTKSAIAKRKAGIITVPCAVFSAEQNPHIRSIIATKAEDMRAPHTNVSQSDITDISTATTGTSFKYKDIPFFTTAIGAHQALNTSLAIDIARSLNIEETYIQKGIARARQPLRMEIAGTNPLIILDGAHNDDKIKSTVTSLRSCTDIHIRPNSTVHIINGFSGDKNLRKMISSLASLSPARVYCTRNTVNHFRKVAHPRAIQAEWNRQSPTVRTEVCINPADALRTAQMRLKKHDILLVTGSIFLSSEIKALLS